MKDFKKLFFLLVAGVLVLGSVTFTDSFKTSLLGVFDQLSHSSPYSIDEVQMEYVYNGDEQYSLVSGVVYKDEQDLNKSYAIVHLEFFNEDGDLIDTKTTTVDTAGIELGERRSFQVRTDKEFETYSYYLE